MEFPSPWSVVWCVCTLLRVVCHSGTKHFSCPGHKVHNQTKTEKFAQFHFFVWQNFWFTMLQCLWGMQGSNRWKKRREQVEERSKTCFFSYFFVLLQGYPNRSVSLIAKFILLPFHLPYFTKYLGCIIILNNWVVLRPVLSQICLSQWSINKARLLLLVMSCL